MNEKFMLLHAMFSSESFSALLACEGFSCFNVFCNKGNLDTYNLFKVVNEVHYIISIMCFKCSVTERPIRMIKKIFSRHLHVTFDDVLVPSIQ